MRLSLAIYLDDCASSKTLVVLLHNAGHHVVTPGDAGITGMDDEVHLHYASQNNLVLLTLDADDFAALHAENPQHSGIFAIYQDNNPNRVMSFGDIVRSIKNLESSEIKISGGFHILNAWQY